MPNGFLYKQWFFFLGQIVVAQKPEKILAHDQISDEVLIAFFPWKEGERWPELEIYRAVVECSPTSATIFCS